MSQTNSLFYSRKLFESITKFARDKSILIQSILSGQNERDVDFGLDKVLQLNADLNTVL